MKYEKVNKKRNYYHSDMRYGNPKLTHAQTKMFSHFLNQRNEAGYRKYNSMDLILDIPKIRLYDPYFKHGESFIQNKGKNMKQNVQKVQKGEHEMRACVSRFLDSPIVKHCCVGSMANFEHTVYKPQLKSKFKRGGHYYPHYSKFHPHVHLTLIVKPHKAYQIDNANQLNKELINNKIKASDYKEAHNWSALKKLPHLTADSAKLSLSEKTTRQLSSGDCTLMNKVWNNTIQHFGANRFGRYTIPKDMNHFYVKPTYIKAKRGHVKAYWSAGWGNNFSKMKPFCYAKPTSRSIRDTDDVDVINHVANDISHESNKYRGMNKAYYKGIKDHDIKRTMHKALNHSLNQSASREFRYFRNSNQYYWAVRHYHFFKYVKHQPEQAKAIYNAVGQHKDKIVGGIKRDLLDSAKSLNMSQNGLKAVYKGYVQYKDQFPRHIYYGKLHDYAQKHIFEQFPQEQYGDSYTKKYKYHEPKHRTVKYSSKPLGIKILDGITSNNFQRNLNRVSFHHHIKHENVKHRNTHKHSIHRENGISIS